MSGKPQPEAELQRAIRLRLGRTQGLVLWRNNVGVARYGLNNARGVVKYGLCDGSSDLIGILKMPDGLGRFIALEVKTDSGERTDKQVLFMDLVRQLGGFAAVVRSEDEAVAAVERALLNQSE